MDYNASATPSSPDDKPVQDKVSGEEAGPQGAGAGKIGSPSTGANKVGAEKVSGSAVSAPARPKGPNASAIVIGLVAMVFAGLIIAKETMDWRIDWSRLGPGAIVGIGVVMVVIGAIGLIRRHDDA
jgi:hypothetical protein